MLTRRKMLSLMSAPLGVVGSGAFTEARAEAFWQVVGNVQIGGVHFSVGAHSPSGGRYGVYPGHYYRTSHRLKHRKHRCGRHCYQRGGYAYHHESCPLLGGHFGRHGAPAPYYGSGYWGRTDHYYYEGYGYAYGDNDHGYGRGRGHRRGHRHTRGRGRGHRRRHERGRW